MDSQEIVCVQTSSRLSSPSFDNLKYEAHLPMGFRPI